MLPRNKRIPRRLFGEFTHQGVRGGSEHFNLRTIDSREVRIAVSVSKKISKKALTRNKIRRRTYSATKDIIPQLSKKLFLLTVKPGIEKMSSDSLKKELAELLLKR